jgi:hypothetical protein
MILSVCKIPSWAVQIIITELSYEVSAPEKLLSPPRTRQKHHHDPSPIIFLYEVCHIERQTSEKCQPYASEESKSRPLPHRNLHPAPLYRTEPFN